MWLPSRAYYVRSIFGDHMPRARFAGILLLALSTALASCSGHWLSGSDCAPVGHFALDIHIREAASGLPVSGATVIVSGAEHDTVALTATGSSAAMAPGSTP
jgi:hypothetical protein